MLDVYGVGQGGAGCFDCFVPSGALSAILIPTFQCNLKLLLIFVDKATIMCFRIICGGSVI